MGLCASKSPLSDVGTPTDNAKRQGQQNAVNVSSSDTQTAVTGSPIAAEGKKISEGTTGSNQTSDTDVQSNQNHQVPQGHPNTGSSAGNPETENINTNHSNNNNNSATATATASVGAGAGAGASTVTGKGSNGGALTKSSTNPSLNNVNTNTSNGSGTNDKDVKILLLGSGESGKSTIVKQMKILHQNGYNDDEKFEYRSFVYKNVMECIRNVLNAIIDIQPELIVKDLSEKKTLSATSEATSISDSEDHQIEALDPIAVRGEHKIIKAVLAESDLKDILNYDYPIDSDEDFDYSVAEKINKVYNQTPEVAEFIQVHQGSFYLIDSTDYFLSQILTLASPNYLPTVQDILRTRKKTSGIFDFSFNMPGLNIHMFDVGGQRSERKKWIHCFDNVTLIMFCVALSEYDQVLLEENTQNRLEESLTLFDSVVNSRWFARTSVVLFLNKIDIFAKKLPHSPLENYFPDYIGGNDVNKAAQYIYWRFTQVNRSGLKIYPHITQATDTSNIELVMAAVRETILENSLRDTGLLN
ncbi:Guanine nucleotide-binding protein alpha-2 subunit [Scheffersomyces spartinae]|uniref:Guanine nucleotide-binding protein alpha-2 subunit n=1 Tax=Scheffersomyces spartinae TaxID=45513 RepID=A0A9P8AIQ9_9ASCO|nr:Guanine nucleotide-binding protein alpha-2 subunit [Scheffersomyces spartinae]KAG7193996.1 Guanine nucleotide-binding protein alpha-2 subunit [Scheffersomyces spartinae]